MRAHATRQFATSAACILACFPTACSTLSPVAADASGERIRTEIKVGDTVRVVAADDTTHSFQVTEIGESSLTGSAVRMSNGGTDAPGARIELPYRDIRRIDLQHVSGLKTGALVGAVAVAAAVAIASGGGSHTPGYTR